MAMLPPAPVVPAAPVVPPRPAVPVVPPRPAVPVVPARPAVLPALPVVPAQPALPLLPAPLVAPTPVVPAPPLTPATPVVPALPAVEPALPPSPALPDVPDVTAPPDVPALPDSPPVPDAPFPPPQATPVIASSPKHQAPYRNCEVRTIVIGSLLRREGRRQSSRVAIPLSMQGSLCRSAGIEALPPLVSCSRAVWSLGFFSGQRIRCRTSGRAGRRTDAPVLSSPGCGRDDARCCGRRRWGSRSDARSTIPV